MEHVEFESRRSQLYARGLIAAIVRDDQDFHSAGLLVTAGVKNLILQDYLPKW